MTDTEILDWIDRNATKLGLKADIVCGPVFKIDDPNPIYWNPDKPDMEFTDIRKRVRELAKKSTARSAHEE